MKLSICIPTYNRAPHLRNCLQSIILNKPNMDFEVCVSDNNSTDETENVVLAVQKELAIKYKRNSRNLGAPRNFLKVVEMACGDFVWLLGDDDLLLPDALEKLFELMNQYPKVDFFYINSFHLTAEYVFSFPQPFNISNIPTNMKPFSSWPHSAAMRFIDLIDPKISFDFLGGMYLSVFRRGHWIASAHIIDETSLSDQTTFSDLDSTFPHIKIFSKAFADSNAFFYATPLSICLTGAREWAPMYRFIRSIRIVEALREYRKNGLSYWQYFRCKNFSLRTFIPDFVYMLINRSSSGFDYIRPKNLISYLLYPNFYLSIIYYFFHKLKQTMPVCQRGL